MFDPVSDGLIMVDVSKPLPSDIVEIFVSSTRVLPRPLPMAELRCGVRDGGVFLSEMYGCISEEYGCLLTHYWF